jgi:hypothetical protein
MARVILDAQMGIYIGNAIAGAVPAPHRALVHSQGRRLLKGAGYFDCTFAQVEQPRSLAISAAANFHRSRAQ